MRCKLLIILLLTSTFCNGQVYNIFKYVTPVYGSTGEYAPIPVNTPAFYTQNLTGAWMDNKYDAFPTVTYRSGNKMAIIYGSRNDHAYAPGNKVDELYSTDGGYTWADRTIIEAVGKEATNWAGGATRDGQTVVLAYKVNSGVSPGTKEGQYYQTSNDGGETYPITGSISTPCDSCLSFFYGKVCEDGAGNLILPYYLLNPSLTRTHVYLQRSTDRGLTWNQFGGIGLALGDSITMNEASIQWMGGGNLIAMIRQDQSEVSIPALIYNSTDTGHTWTKIGYLKDAEGFIASGISPTLVKKDSNTVTAITTRRGNPNTMAIFDFDFGSNLGYGYTNVAMLLKKEMGSFNNDEGYAGEVIWNPADTSTWMFAYYQTSQNWSYSPDSLGNKHITDISITPIYQDSLLGMLANTANYNDGAYVNWDAYTYNQINGRNLPYLLYIQQSGSYAIDVVADFGTSNTGGTYRTITVQRFNSGGYVSDFSTVTQDNTNSVFNTTATATLTSGENIRLKINHDSGTPLTGKITILIRKL